MAKEGKSATKDSPVKIMGDEWKDRAHVQQGSLPPSETSVFMASLINEYTWDILTCA
jgi:hypothetical protein